MKRSPSRYTTTPKGTKFHQKNRSLLVHVDELSTAVVKGDIEVINASLTQNQCFQYVTPRLTHVGIPRPCDAIELNNDGTIDQVRRRPLPKSNRIYQFFLKRFNKR